MMKAIKIYLILMFSLFIIEKNIAAPAPPSKRPDYRNLVVTSLPGGKIHVKVENTRSECCGTDDARWKIDGIGWHTLNLENISQIESSVGLILTTSLVRGSYTFTYEGTNIVLDNPDTDSRYSSTISIAFYHEYGRVDNSVTSTAVTEAFDAVLTMQKLTTSKSSLRKQKIYSNYFRFDGSQTDYTFYFRYKINNLINSSRLIFSLELYTEKDGMFETWTNYNSSHSDHVDIYSNNTASGVWQSIRTPKDIFDNTSWGWGGWTVGDIITADENQFKWARIYAILYNGGTNQGGDVDIEFMGVKEGDHPETLADDYAISRSFADGMGRAKQSLVLKQSPAKNDIVTPVKYDEVGRQARSYLPYTAASRDGALHENALIAQKNFYTTAKPPGVAYNGLPFAQTVFENSPMNRVIEQGAPGEVWQPYNSALYNSGHTIKSFHRTNTSSDAVIIWNTDGSSSGFYPAGELIVTRTKDENGHSSWEYTDKSGQVILKKFINESKTLLTYYVYDKRGNLRIIIPPKAAGSYDANLVTTFEYDDENRLISKIIPEMDGHIFTVYDKLGRAVLTQDPILEADNKWMFTKFDIQGRAIMRGVYEETSAARYSRENMQTHLNTITAYWEERSPAAEYGYTTNLVFPAESLDVWTVTWYDDYDYDNDGSPDEVFANPAEAGYETGCFARLRGKVTGSKVKVGILDGKGGVYLGGRTLNNCPASPNELYYQGDRIVLKPGFHTHPGQNVYIGPNIDLPAGYEESGETWLSSVSFYDKYGRVIQSQSDNHLGGKDISHTQYDFSGKVVKAKLIHQTDYKTVTVRNRFEYDHAGRLINTYQKNDADAEILTVNNKYNELGQLIKKNLHSTNGTSFTQSVDYRYNIRGWLVSINSTLFNMNLEYDGGLDDLDILPQYNGNITAIVWNAVKEQYDLDHVYGYEYDQINQLKSARYGMGDEYSIDYYSDYDVNNLTYDLNGNIRSAIRFAKIDGNKRKIDDLTYEYSGNQLIKVADAAADRNVNDFKDGHTGTVNSNIKATWEYHYDANGNMNQDKNKGIDFIEYNYLNLPVKVVFDNDNWIEWTYTVTGAKLRKQVYMDGALEYTKDYCGGFEYTNNVMEYFATGEGRVVDNGGSYEYQYNLKDHLGNVRVAFADVGGNAALRQIKHYYPFGLEMPGLGMESGGDVVNKYQYNGKELEDDEFAGGKSLMWLHYGARYYDPQLGRWHSVDPMDEFHSPYTYVGNSPINFIDPFGMDTWWDNIDTGELTFTPSLGPDEIVYTMNPIVAEESRHEMSDLDPISWVSLIVFGNDNYNEILFNKEKAMASLPNMCGFICLSGVGAVGGGMPVATKGLNIAGKAVVNTAKTTKKLAKPIGHFLKKYSKEVVEDLKFTANGIKYFYYRNASEVNAFGAGAIGGVTPGAPDITMAPMEWIGWSSGKIVDNARK